jgi:hypothetical protein
MLRKWSVRAIAVVDWVERRSFGCFRMFVMDVMFLCVNLFMLLEILGSLEGFAANL